jgi:hypothetical protein
VVLAVQLHYVVAPARPVVHDDVLPQPLPGGFCKVGVGYMAESVIDNDELSPIEAQLGTDCVQ